MREFLNIVNQQNKIIGKALKTEIYQRLLTHRIAHLLIFNDQGKMALQLRSRHKSFCPLHWGTAAGGHVRVGETYKQAILRECEEELGYKTKVEFMAKDLYDDGSGLKKFLATFRAIANGPFNINSAEVDKVDFFDLDQMRQMIKKGERFHPELLFLLRKHFDISFWF